MNIDRLSIANYKKLFPSSQNFFRRRHPRSYAEFTDVLYDDIFASVVSLEKAGNVRQGDSEDRITLDLCAVLKAYGDYVVQHDAYSGGHVDVTVTHIANGHEWIAEAKIFRSTSDLAEGFRQLTDRYKSPPPQDKGGMLAYIFKKNAKVQMDAWRTKLSTMKLHSLRFAPCTRRRDLNFYSTHKHTSTGMDFEVWHGCVILHHEPTDKSARTSAKRKKAARPSERKRANKEAKRMRRRPRA